MPVIYEWLATACANYIYGFGEATWTAISLGTGNGKDIYLPFEQGCIVKGHV